ncbi:MAG TPA: hypothetical protein VJ739_18230 [Gemmataceae bacterium]|nr:hypothetical protein [Gemmataceae bacterium]
MRRWLTGAAVLGALLLVAATARAERTPMTRTSGQRTQGARPSVAVPYLTTGRQAFGAYSVAPRIYSSPVVDDPANPQAKPVYNLQYYGSTLNFGDRSTGAGSRQRPLTPDR